MFHQPCNVAQIEGIGDKRASDLNKLGIYTTSDLVLHSEDLLKMRLENLSGFPIASLGEFLKMAKLTQAEGIDGQYAEALFKAGKTSLAIVGIPHPRKLVEIMDEAVEKRLIPNSIDLDTAIQWQKDAIRISLTGSVAGTVECNDCPVEAAEIHCNGSVTRTDARGRFHLPGIETGKRNVGIVAEGYEPYTCPIKVEMGVTPSRNLEIDEAKPEQERETFSEMTTGIPISMRSGDIINIVTKELKDLPNGTPLKFRKEYKNGDGKLLGIYRERKGNVIEGLQVKVPMSGLGKDVNYRDVFVVVDGQLKKSEMASIDFRQKLNPLAFYKSQLLESATAQKKLASRLDKKIENSQVRISEIKQEFEQHSTDFQDGALLKIVAPPKEGRVVLSGFGRRSKSKRMSVLVVSAEALSLPDDWKVGQYLLARKGKLVPLEPRNNQELEV